MCIRDSIYTARDIAEDAHYRARGMLHSMTVDGLTLDVPGIVPHLSATPGAIRRLAPALGEHNDEVLRPLRDREDPHAMSGGDYPPAAGPHT